MTPAQCIAITTAILANAADGWASLAFSTLAALMLLSDTYAHRTTDSEGA